MQMKPSTTPSEWLMVGLIMLVAAIMSGYTAMIDPVWKPDSAVLVESGVNLLSGRGFSYRGNPVFVQMPFYGVTAALLDKFVGNIERSAILVSSLSYLLLILAVYRFCRTVFTKEVAFISAVLVAFCPEILLHSRVSLSESYFSLLYFMSFSTFATLLLYGPTWSKSIAFALFSGTAFLTRAEGFLPAILAYITLAGIVILPKLNRFCWPKHDYKSSVQQITVSAFLFLLVIAPWLLHVHKHTGTWDLGRGGAAFLVHDEVVAPGVQPSKEAELYQQYRKDYGQHQKLYTISSIDYIRNNLDKILDKTKRNLKILFNIEISILLENALVPLLFLFSLLLFFPSQAVISISRWHRKRNLIAWSVLIYLSPAVVLLLYMVLTRYLLPYQPLLLVVIALMIRNTMTALPVNRNRLLAAVGIVFFAYLTLPLPGVYYKPQLPEVFKTRLMGDSQQVRAAGLWLAEHCVNSGELRLAMPERRDAILLQFYASNFDVTADHVTEHKKFFNFQPELLLSDLASLAHRGEIDLIVIQENDTRQYPEMLKLWNEGEDVTPLGIFLLHTDNHYKIFTTRREMKQRCR
ncbi:MAG: glycosyltransferase family 39 protein [Nitrospirae bacterium]|nr:glycosyltransferase family 39 protein [Magnetococcales bacterium]HAT50165.1 hypothetical protein [Alphaproteobacteria bacterium]